MPQRAWSDERERQYQHIKKGVLQRGEDEDTAEEIAARTVNKERARSGEAKQASRSSTRDISSGRRGGLRSHRGAGGRTKTGSTTRPTQENQGPLEDEQGPAGGRGRPLTAPEPHPMPSPGGRLPPMSLVLASRFGLGTAPLGSLEAGPLWWGPQDRSTTVATVRTAIDAGIRWVDTASFYGWGLAEEIVGEAVRGRRDQVTILTKCGTTRGSDGSWAEDGSAPAIRADLEASLGRLGIDRVDVLQLHDPDPSVPIEESVGAMAELVSEGKVGHIGLSNHDTELLERAHAEAPIAVVQHQWSLLHHPDSADAARRW